MTIPFLHKHFHIEHSIIHPPSLTFAFNWLLVGNQPLGSMVSTLDADYVGRGSNPITAFWGSDLMVGNLRDPSHLQVRELWVRVVVSPIIAQMCPTLCQIRVQVGRDNDRTY